MRDVVANLDLFEHCAWHHVFALDDSILRVANSTENRKHFGLAGGRSERGYPLIRLAARSHLTKDCSGSPMDRIAIGWLVHIKSTTKWTITKKLGTDD